MVRAELIETPQVQQETGLMNVDNVPDVDTALEQWNVYQKICKGLLDENDYQEIEVKEKDEHGNYVKVKRHFKKNDVGSTSVETESYSDRPIDIDILLYDDLTVDEPDLQIPHPLMQERDFVMIPLKELTNP